MSSNYVSENDQLPVYEDPLITTGIVIFGRGILGFICLVFSLGFGLEQ